MPKGFSTLIPRLILQKELPGIPRRKGRQEGERERQIKKHRERERITEMKEETGRERGRGEGAVFKDESLEFEFSVC